MAGVQGVTMAQTLIWQRLVGQPRIKNALSTTFIKRSFGHAYLFCGPAGVGKFQAALELSLALLCENETEVPCYNCHSCKQILNFSHPDFHLVFPISLEAKHKNAGDSTKLSEKGWEYINELTRLKLTNPYDINESRLGNIPVEWIRELNQRIRKGATQGKINIAIICDIDIVLTNSANAMLKTLEEPPSNTLLLLLTQRPHAVLQTIRSRCQILRFGGISSSDLTQVLTNNESASPNRSALESIVECASGSYGKALQMLKESSDTYTQEANILLNLCLQNKSIPEISTTVEKIVLKNFDNGYNHAAVESLLLTILHLTRSLAFQSIGNLEKYIYLRTRENNSSSSLTITQTNKIIECCEKAIRAIRARGNILLVLFTFLVTLTEIIHGKK